MKKLVLAGFLIMFMHLIATAQSTASHSVPPYGGGGNVNQTYKNTTNTSARTGFEGTACDNVDVRVFPSPNAQSEVHISIDRINPQNLVLSANTYTTDYQQGKYVSTDGGNTWNGSDELVTGTRVNGDPSTTFDFSENIYISTIASDANGFNIIRRAHILSLFNREPQ